MFFKGIREKRRNEMVLFLIFIILFVLMSVLSPNKFLSSTNLQNMCFQMPEFGLMALAMMAAVLTGGMNLSIITGSMLSAIVAGFFMSSEFSKANPVAGTILGILIIMGISLLTGIVNGYLIGYVGCVAMLITLGTRMIFEGIGLRLTKGGSVSGFPEQFSSIGSATIGWLPVTILIYLLMVIVTYFLLERSRFGHEVYMLGSNEVATRFSGVNTRRVIFLVYVFSSFCYGLSGVLISAHYVSAKVDYGSSYLMQAVTAVVLGGTSINGGEGTVAGTVIAVMIMQTISTGLNIFGTDRYIINIITGGILIAVLAIRHITGILSDRRKIAARKEKSSAT
jgi:inner-membrane translocator